MIDSLFHALLLPLAHVGGHHGGSGFVSGFTHPAMGSDHLLAMLAVGLLAARIGGRNLWLLPLLFLGVMVTGGLLGLSGASLIGLETAIVGSVALFGIALAAGTALPKIALTVGVGFFAFFHGFAHGAEIPESASAMLFTVGYGLGTAVLLAFGVVVGLLLMEARRGGLLLRISGLLIAAMGIQLWVTG